jgi:hypothetical protein
MAVNRPDKPNPAPEQPMGGQVIILAVVGLGCGIFTATRLALIMPVWAAIVVTFLLWIFLVGVTATYGSDLLDVLVGSAVIIIFMILLVPLGVRAWQQKHEKVQPPVVNLTRVDNRPRLSCRAKYEISQRWIESLNDKWPISATKESLLPQGEGQDEGEPRRMTKRPVNSFERSGLETNHIFQN